jgi:hypothetical protein
MTKGRDGGVHAAVGAEFAQLARPLRFRYPESDIR